MFFRGMFGKGNHSKNVKKGHELRYTVGENLSAKPNEDVYMDAKEGEYDDFKHKRRKANENERTEQVYDRAVANAITTSDTHNPYDAMEKQTGDVAFDETYSHMKGGGQKNANNYYDVSDHGANKQFVSEGNPYDSMQQNT